MKRRTFIAAAVAAMFPPPIAPRPPASTTGAFEYVDCTMNLAEYLHGAPLPMEIGRWEGFRVIESPSRVCMVDDTLHVERLDWSTLYKDTKET